MKTTFVEFMYEDALGTRKTRKVVVEWDDKRGIELDFIPSKANKPAQHRIFVRHTRYGTIPMLITRFVDSTPHALPHYPIH